MNREHRLTPGFVKRCNVAALEAIRVKLGLFFPMARQGTRIMKKDYVDLLCAHLETLAFRLNGPRFLSLPAGLVATRPPVNRAHTHDVIDLTIESRPPPPAAVVAVPTGPGRLQFIPHANQTYALCLECVSQSGWMLQWCNPVLLTDELEWLAVCDTPYALQWVRKHDTVLYRALCALAVAADGWTIEFIESPTAAMRLLALRQDWSCHQLLTAPLSAEEQAVVDAGRVAEEERRKRAIIHITIDA